MSYVYLNMRDRTVSNVILFHVKQEDFQFSRTSKMYSVHTQHINSNIENRYKEPKFNVALFESQMRDVLQRGITMEEAMDIAEMTIMIRYSDLGMQDVTRLVIRDVKHIIHQTIKEDFFDDESDNDSW